MLILSGLTSEIPALVKGWGGHHTVMRSHPRTVLGVLAFFGDKAFRDPVTPVVFRPGWACF